MEFLIVNNEIIRKDEANLTAFFWNEPLLFTHKMWFGFGGIPLFTENLKLIHQQLQLFNVPIWGILKNRRELFRITKRMLNKNKFYRSGLINFHIYIHDQNVNVVITSTAFSEFELPISTQGLLIHFSTLKKDSKNPHNRYSFANQLFWNLEQIENQNNPVQNSIFLNEKDAISDAISANVFMIKNKTIITPAIQTGCFVDNLRSHILEISAQLKLKILESEKITKNEILDMNEVFLASEAKGIEWVLGIGIKRFVHQVSIEIRQELNAFLKGKVH